MIQYADEDQLASEQRLALAHLAPLRGEISSLIDGWRASFRWKDLFGRKAKQQAEPPTEGGSPRAATAAAEMQSRARRFDRRTADALVVALQGDQASAELLLRAIKQDILDERMSTGRVQYVLAAWGFALALCLLLGVVVLIGHPVLVAKNNVWEIASLGCLGALFSIAIGIRGRAIQTDLRLRDNLVDAGLRILIGAISAIVLYALFRSGFISLAIGDEPIRLCNGADCSPPAATVVLSFLAGFSERLVGNLLDSKVLPAVADAGGNLRPSALPSAAVIAEARREPNENNPLGRPETAAAAAATEAAAATAAANDGDAAVDHCLCDVDTEDDEQMDDVDLPQAIGGVERAA
ncbi:hypothetical protein [Methylopila sp. M107]|uniref:hypothetical protein n=1 Tax=Methylopila sp. M107 TaxID=1101190 RepID=UPI00036FB39D|nr:hypothetical protein [Methylopila sp. M107]